MAKYVVVEESYSYNDEFYEGYEGYNIQSKLFDTKEEADIECNKRNEKLLKEADEEGDEYWFVDYEGVPITPFKVVKIEE